ncbi:ParA family protein [Weissella cibaria]|uniref:ParA family protein n=1 Tax=Weissella cibaria TaxID=137591 RepID=UPI0028F43C1F|nr:ParA family protein [Weissella cibaria]
MAKIIAFYNNKGGVAKTTTATNIAGVLSLENKKTLLIDGGGLNGKNNSFLQ